MILLYEILVCPTVEKFRLFQGPGVLICGFHFWVLGPCLWNFDQTFRSHFEKFPVLIGLDLWPRTNKKVSLKQQIFLSWGVYMHLKSSENIWKFEVTEWWLKQGLSSYIQQEKSDLIKYLNLLCFGDICNISWFWFISIYCERGFLFLIVFCSLQSRISGFWMQWNSAARINLTGNKNKRIS